MSSNSGATRVPAWAKTLGPQSPTEEPAREELHVQAKAEDGQTADVPETTTPATSGALLVEQHDLSETEAYTLCSLAGDLKIAEVVNEPNRLVTMQISKAVLGMS